MAVKKLAIKPPAPVRNPVLDQLPGSSFGTPTKSQPSNPAPPAITGQLPLPGRPVALASAAVGTIDPKSLTERERQMLNQAGWQEGRNIPANMAHILEEVRIEQTDLTSMPPPDDPSKVPPLVMPDEIPEGNLSPEYRARVRQALDEADQQAALYEQIKNTGAANPQVANAALGRTDMEIPVVDDRVAAAPQPPPVALENKVFCSHCGWDQALRDQDVITQGDRNMYAQSILGGQIWRKTFDDLLGGRMQITVRQLMPDELDECYQQAMWERIQSKAPVDAAIQDFWEQMARYRVCLQFQTLRTTGNVGDETLDIVTLPESLDEWKQDAAPDEKRGPTVLPLIFDTIIKEGRLNEARWRIVQSTVNRFNRLAAKLEAQADVTGFWKTP